MGGAALGLVFDNFNPRSPCGERRLKTSPGGTPPNFNPRSPCGERRGCPLRICVQLPISIHALLAESDAAHPDRLRGDHRISIHALLAESDPNGRPRAPAVSRFQSTLSLRRATPPAYPPSSWQSYFNPRSPCGERPGRVLLGPHRQDISIHALLAESDIPMWVRSLCPSIFQSTLSLRRATRHYGRGYNSGRISIHALLAESDGHRENCLLCRQTFQSTLSLRRATDAGYFIHLPCGISIHALLAESDPSVVMGLPTLPHFNPRSPCGERLSVGRSPYPTSNFNPRSPCGERRCRWRDLFRCRQHFNPRSPCGERQMTNEQAYELVKFQSTLSLRRATSSHC